MYIFSSLYQIKSQNIQTLCGSIEASGIQVFLLLRQILKDTSVHPSVVGMVHGFQKEWCRISALPQYSE